MAKLIFAINGLCVDATIWAFGFAFQNASLSKPQFY
jgi:hypothetical protein